MSLWVDKYRPNTLAKLTLHGEINNKLMALAKSEELPHLLFYGPPGYKYYYYYARTYNVSDQIS